MLTVYPSAPLPNFTDRLPSASAVISLMHASGCEGLPMIWKSHLEHAGIGALDAGSLIMQALHVSAKLVQVV